MTPTPQMQLDYATLLVELGWLHDAEIEVSAVLDRSPDDPRAVGLFAKIKHIRGELSQAIGCWARLYVVGGRSHSAQTQLTALLHFAQDPERGAGEYLALGGHQMVRKPTGQLALEEAFRLFLARQPEEARARCVELAAEYRLADQHVYKLAVLAIAWLAELSGDLDEAVTFLERLGKERGFATDRDRLIALERVYEHQDSPARWEAAIKICRHLESDPTTSNAEHVSLRAKLAELHRRLGRNDEAARLETELLAAYRDYMHRPSFSSAVAVAARHYVPLAKLAGLRTPDREVHTVDPRARAIADALLGRRGQAREQLQRGADVIDRKYLADLAAEEGDLEDAALGYMAACEGDPDDMHIVGWLLDHSTLPGVSRWLSDVARRERCRLNLEAAVQRAPLRPSLWRRLAVLHQLGGDSDRARRCADRAAVLADAARSRSHPVGRVLSASVYHFIGTAKGLIHEVWVHRDPVEPGSGGRLPPENILGNLSPDMKESIRNVFVAVRSYARARFPAHTGDLADYDYTFKLPKEDEPSGGLSAGLPAALAFMSVFLQREVPQDTAFSGVLIADAHDVLTVHAVGDVVYKVFAGYHRNIRQLILPAANRSELVGLARVPSAVRSELVSYVADLDDAVKLVWGETVFVDAANERPGSRGWPPGSDRSVRSPAHR